MLQRGLRRLASYGPVHVASACSGSDVQWHVLLRLSSFWRITYAIDVVVKMVFACELNEAKQTWLRTQSTEIPLLFRDINELSRTTSFDVITQSHRLVPHCDLFVAGFVCADRSALNRNRARNVGCVATATGQAGATSVAALQFIRTCRPTMVVMENVPALQQSRVGSDGETTSDADYIIGQLRSFGYGASYGISNAHSHGSFATRERLYIVAYLGQDPSHAVDARMVARSMTIPPIAYTRVFGINHEDWQPVRDHWATHVPQTGPRRDMTYVDEHLDLYRSHGMSYPPTFDDCPVAFKDALRPLSDRCRELVYFAENSIAYPEHDDTPQFMDVNCSARFLAGRGFWSSGGMPCITGSSKMFARVRRHNGRRDWCLVPGHMLLHIVGIESVEPCDDSLLTSLAVNAFSAYSIGTTFIGVFACLPPTT